MGQEGVGEVRIDSFYTEKYKDCFIHQAYVNGHLEVEWQTPDHTRHKTNTWLGAKRAITKWYKETHSVSFL